MFRRIAISLALVAGFAMLLPSSALARGRGLISKTYKSATTAALRAGSYALSRNNTLRGKHGVFTARRVATKGTASRTPTGLRRIKVVTRKSIAGPSSTPLAEVTVTVRKTKAGWRAYNPGKRRVKINKAAKRTTRRRGYEGGFGYLGME